MRIDKAIVQQEIAKGKMRFKFDNLQHDSIFVGSKQCTVVSCMPHLSSFLSFFSFSFSFFSLCINMIYEPVILPLHTGKLTENEWQES
jgi:hypothetical protein